MTYTRRQIEEELGIDIEKIERGVYLFNTHALGKLVSDIKIGAVSEEVIGDAERIVEEAWKYV